MILNTNDFILNFKTEGISQLTQSDKKYLEVFKKVTGLESTDDVTVSDEEIITDIFNNMYPKNPVILDFIETYGKQSSEGYFHIRVMKKMGLVKIEPEEVQPEEEQKRLPKEYCNYTLSADTLHSNDMIHNFDIFFHTCKHIVPSFLKKFDKLKREFYINMDKFFASTQKDQSALETTEFIMQDIEKMLHDIAPENCMYGTHSGDGAHFGFWQIKCPVKLDKSGFIRYLIENSHKDFVTEILQDLLTNGNGPIDLLYITVSDLAENFEYIPVCHIKNLVEIREFYNLPDGVDFFEIKEFNDSEIHWI